MLLVKRSSQEFLTKNDKNFVMTCGQQQQQKRMQHVALITTSYPDNASGSEAAGSFVADFASEMSKHVRVTVVAPSSTSSTEIAGNFEVIRFAVPRLPLSLLNPLLPHHWLPILHTLRAGQDALQQVVQDSTPDHVLALWALPSGYWAERVARRHGLRFSVWALGSDIWGLGKVPVVRQILKRVLRRANRRYADGILLASDVKELCGMPCEFLPSTRRLTTGAGPKTTTSAPYNLAFLGRWHPNKGIDLLLDALGQLTNDDWARIAKVRIYGGGPLHDHVQSAVLKLRQQGRPISVGGYLDKEAATELIDWADFLLLPSRIESIPVIFSDAVQLRTPIISTPIGDLPRLHEKYQFGVVATETNASAYVEALKKAIRMDATVFDSALVIASKDFDLAEIVKRFLKDAGGDQS